VVRRFENIRASAREERCDGAIVPWPWDPLGSKEPDGSRERSLDTSGCTKAIISAFSKTRNLSQSSFFSRILLQELAIFISRILAQEIILFY
jgi:hypothetical protein